MATQRIDQIGMPLAANDSAARWRVLLAHDGALPTCDALALAIAHAMDDVQILDAPSAESARATLRRIAVDVCFVCLDLPPSPLGGIKLAQELVRAGCPIVLVTRSLRWLPRSAAELKILPWVAPEATVDDVVRAVDAAVGAFDFDAENQVTLDGELDDEAPAPQRISVSDL
jgi:hypothetical protein